MTAAQPTVFDAPQDMPDIRQQVADLLPLIEGNAATAEQQRKPVDVVMEALASTDIFKAFVPRRFGGLEIDLDTFIDVGLMVGEACTSTGWVTTFYMEHNWMLAQFCEQAQSAVFGKQSFIMAPASISPNGRAERVAGGYRLDGRWAWGTGIMHADWVILNGVIAGEKPEPRLFLVPRDTVEVEDVWFTSGMRGTGSNDMLANNVFVPEMFSEPLKGMSVGRGQGAEFLGSATYRHPMLPLLAIAAAIPALAASRKALRLFEQRIQERTLYGSDSKQGQSQSAHIRLGLATSEIESAEWILRQVGHHLEQWGRSETICPGDERAKLRLMVASVVRRCRDAVMTIVEASGASAHMDDHPMQRLQRDINMLSCHTVFDLDVAAENVGKLRLGLEPATPV